MKSTRGIPISLRGLTLIELLVSAGILAFTLTGILAVFINCILLNEANRNLVLAYNATQTKIEEIKDASFDCISTSSCPGGCATCFRNGDTFSLSGFAPGSSGATIQITSEASNLKRVRIISCFMSRNRLFGDNINNCQSSPVDLVTLVVR